MSDEQTSDSKSDTTPNPNSRKRRRFLVFGGVGLAALAGLVSGKVWAHGRGTVHGHRHGHGHGHGMQAQSATELREHLGEGTDRVLSQLDATDAQRVQVSAVLDRVSRPLFELRERGNALREQFHVALASGDRNALELSRSRGVALVDELSALGLGALKEVHGVLDATQKAELRALLERGGHRHRGRWH